MTDTTTETIGKLLDGVTDGPWRLVDDEEAGEPAPYGLQWRACDRTRGWDFTGHRLRFTASDCRQKNMTALRRKWRSSTRRRLRGGFCPALQIRCWS